MRVAVVGGGIFGATAAIELARAGAEVDLYEARHALLMGASRANPGRLHSGYHYPRSPETTLTARRAAGEFAQRFPTTLAAGTRHFYCVANEGSKTSPGGYRAFCETYSLPYDEGTWPPLVRSDTVGLCVRVPERIIDLRALRGVLRRELTAAEVTPCLGRPATPDMLADYDWTVYATYGRHWPAPLRYEVCETVLVRLGEQYAGKSFVVLDGEFVSLDPLPGTRLHMLYDVRHSVHAVNEGTDAEIPSHLASLVDKGPVYTPYTHMDPMLQTARRFLRAVGMPDYCGSLFTVRAVLPDVDATDERPTLIEREGRVISVLSGKIDTAVWAARRVAQTVHETVPVG